jgi:uncharacterized protein YfaS (alpha-2-macroglobulin family)
MLEKDGHTNIVVRLTAPEEPGEMGVAYSVKGMGETHHERIILPVRPAVAWVETSGITASEKMADTVGKVGRLEKLFTKEYDTPLGGYESALRWLAEYPHGCLEQTSSRMFPLIGAGGMCGVRIAAVILLYLLCLFLTENGLFFYKKRPHP